MKRLWHRFRLWREARLFNRAMNLIARESSYFTIAEASLIEMRRHRALKNTEAGITGMYD